ncbi:Dimer-Tnp-hAT domain containing protein, partial [Pyrenophora tritici-repentis]
PEWLTSANAGFLQLWQSYKPQRTRPLSQTTAKPRHRGIDDVIGALVRRNKAQVEAAHDDEYERWRTQEPEWTSEQYLSDGHPVKYWIQLRSKYPCLSQFAIDILTIPASSCDCERLFSELGDLLEPRRRALGSELLAALQLVRSWRRAGFDGLYNNGDDEDKWSDVKDEEICIANSPDGIAMPNWEKNCIQQSINGWYDVDPSTQQLSITQEPYHADYVIGHGTAWTG